MLVDYSQKLKKMQTLENERKKRIFNDKERLIGVDKRVLQNQIAEKKKIENQQRVLDENSKKKFNFLCAKAMQEENLIKYKAYRESEFKRQSENRLLAEEQKLKNNKINEEALSNIPSDEYYNYFNTSSR